MKYTFLIVQKYTKSILHSCKGKPPSASGYLTTANFRTLRVFPQQVLASSCLPQQILKFLSNLFTHFDDNPNPTRNTRKFPNKFVNDTSGEINLQSKQDIICQVPKVKPATLAHYVADVIPFLAYIIFPSNPKLR